MTPPNRFFLGAQRLAGKEINDLSAGLVGFLDRLKNGETIEGIGLSTKCEPGDLVLVGNFLAGGGSQRE